MGREKPITSIALLPLCRPSNTGPFLLRCHFVAVVLPRFTIVLTNEIRVKKMGEPEVRHGSRTFFLRYMCLVGYSPATTSVLPKEQRGGGFYNG